jgi:hypothetical protein
MATALTRPVSRMTQGAHRGRPLVVTLEPGDLISVRHARTRTSYTLTLGTVYDLAVKLKVLADKRQGAEGETQVKPKTIPSFGHSIAARGTRAGAASLLRLLRKSGHVRRKVGEHVTVYYPADLSGWIVVVPR